MTQRGFQLNRSDNLVANTKILTRLGFYQTSFGQLKSSQKTSLQPNACYRLGEAMEKYKSFNKVNVEK